MDEKDYSYLKSKISKLTRIDIDAYKSQQMRRRLEGFVARYDPSSVAAYCQTLEQDQGKLKELQDFLTINVSEFFRDAPHFQYLRARVLPELLRRSPRLNIWSAACSRGQEPYSVAIILEELCPQHNHRILATDIDDGALERARNGGPYPAEEVKNVEERLLRKFFVRAGDGYWVADRIKRRVQFRRHNLLCDTFEQGFDLVICRNVIIYFSNDVRDELYQRFHRTLKVEGVLFIGGSEVILRASDVGFANLSPSFYRKHSADVVAALPSRA